MVSVLMLLRAKKNEKEQSPKERGFVTGNVIRNREEGSWRVAGQT